MQWMHANSTLTVTRDHLIQKPMSTFFHTFMVLIHWKIMGKNLNFCQNKYFLSKWQIYFPIVTKNADFDKKY